MYDNVQSCHSGSGDAALGSGDAVAIGGAATGLGLMRACCSYVMICGAVEEEAEEAQIFNASRVSPKKGGSFWRPPFFFYFFLTNLIFCDFAPLAPLLVTLVT